MAVKVEPDEMIVRKSATLIQHSYIKEDQKNNEMTTQEQRLWDFLVSKIDPEANKFVPVRFNIYDYCRTMNLEYNGRVYRDIQTCLDSFAAKKVWITETTYDGKTRDVLCHWVSNVIMYPNSGVVDVRFDEFMGPYLLLKKSANATIYDALWTRDCKSKYSRRLYEYCKADLTQNNLESGDVIVSVTALKTAMYAEKLRYFSDFKRRALEPAMQDINDYSPYSIDMAVMPAKTGDSLRFKFTRKEGTAELPSVTIYHDAIPEDVRYMTGEASALPPDSRTTYGEYGWVRLTGEEYARLVEQFGEDVTERSIRYIDESAQTTGNKNGWKDWFLIVRRCAESNWYRAKETAQPKKHYSAKTFQRTQQEPKAEGEELDEFVIASIRRRMERRENHEDEK